MMGPHRKFNGRPSGWGSTLGLLDELKKHPQGITSNDLGALLDRNVQTAVSKLFAYGVIDRTPGHRDFLGRTQFLYRTKLPKITAPPSADVESPCVASQTAGVE